MSKENFYFQKAAMLCVRAHAGQLDKAGRPYCFHPMAVASKLDGRIFQTIALLHDVIEDTDWTLIKLREEFSKRIIDAVDALSRRNEEKYKDYIERVIQNPDALVVKIVDMEHNLFRLEQIKDEKIRKGLRKRYTKTLAYLKGL